MSIVKWFQARSQQSQGDAQWVDRDSRAGATAGGSRFLNLARVLFAANLALSVAAWYISSELVARRAQNRFEYETKGLADDIRQRMVNYEQVLRGGIGLFKASGWVDRHAWRDYVAALRIHEAFPGIQGLGFTLRVPPQEKDALVKKIRAEGFPNFDIKPAGPREEYHSIIYLEPFDWRNQRAFGYDMYSNSARREAMERARDGATTAISGIVTLVQETEKNVQRGFLLYLPLYKGGSVPDSTEQRRADLIGFVYSPFRANDLMRGILGPSTPNVGFTIYDGSERTEKSLLYASDESQAYSAPDSTQLARTLEVNFGGRVWQVDFYSRPGFIPLVESGQPLAILIAGAILSSLIFLFMASLASRERLARSLAEGMTLELREREQQVRGIIDSAQDAFISVDGKGVIAVCNKAAENLFGWSEAELLGEKFLGRLVSATDRDKIFQPLARFIAANSVPLTAYRWQIDGMRRGGEKIPLDLSLAIQQLGTDRFLNIFARDMTDQVKAREQEAELARLELDAQTAMTAYKAERKFRAFMESAPDAMVIADRQGQIVLINSQTEKLFGYTAEELVGQPVEILVPDRFRGHHPGHREKFFADPKSRPMGQDFELFGKAKDGREFPIEISLSPIVTDDGTFVSSAIRDITRRKMLHEDNQRLAEIVRSSNSAMFSIALDGTIQNWNVGAEALFGYSAEEALAKTASGLTQPEHRRVWESYLARLKAGEAVAESDTVGVRRDGSCVDISISVAPIADGQGAIVGGSLICRDLTERKRTEVFARKNVDLETLLYVTSHDLREPLRTIENFSRMVIDRYGADLHDKGKDFLDRVLRAAIRMNRLLDDILALSRAQCFDTPTQPLAGETIVQDALKSLSEKIEATGAKVTLAAALPEFRANPIWATQAVVNLIANALKFSRPGEAPEIDIDAYEAGDEVGLVVKDRGPGVEERHANRIFNLFQRAVGRDVEGTGAGLAIVKQVAQRHGGRAWVAPRNGGGSEFYITFNNRAAGLSPAKADNWTEEGR